MCEDAGVIDEFRAAFQELIDASVATDPQPFPAAAHKVYTLVPHVPEEERELALEALAPILGGGHALPGVAADLSLIAGAMVESGTTPGATGVEVVRLLRLMGKGAAVFLSAWERTGGGPPPDPDTVTAEAEERVAADLAEAAPTATVCWWTIRRHGLAAKTMLGTSAVRAAIRADPALHAELVAVSNQLSSALWEFDEVRTLLRMAETTSAVVLDRASGRGFRVLFDGIGDNYQLHALLADALIGPEGHGLAGERPDPRWTASYRTSAPDPEARIVRSWWNLTSADGSWIWNEGVPADIPAIDGERIVVLDAQPFPRTWSAGRRHPHVPGWLEVEEELTSDEAFLWWRRVATTTSASATHAAQDTSARTGQEPSPRQEAAPATDTSAPATAGFPTAVPDGGAAARPALEEIRASAGPITRAAQRAEPHSAPNSAPAGEESSSPEPQPTPDDAPPPDAQLEMPTATEEDPQAAATAFHDADPAPPEQDAAPSAGHDDADGPVADPSAAAATLPAQDPAQDPAAYEGNAADPAPTWETSDAGRDPAGVDAFLERMLGSLQAGAEQSGPDAPDAPAPADADHDAAPPADTTPPRRRRRPRRPRLTTGTPASKPGPRRATRARRAPSAPSRAPIPRRPRCSR
ncbi:hypothetical protein CDO52_15085 [Nocardiopsis gilva YIM 90087]|uniref:Uncharacterized protein n=1 Tax=Nocardiopsis gilva YIM 90087 TaxID=1235441 RepID=A0A223S717_9ACTN|nr:hypothetical protein CDO52_15085 [Nocardiopsis gilva YIM 90087]